MKISIVDIHIKPGYSEEFIAATKLNARMSNKEEGVFRFDFIRQKGNPNHFLLLEYFLDEKAQVDHRDSDHYLVWKQSVEEMMEKPRESTVYEELLIKE